MSASPEDENPLSILDKTKGSLYSQEPDRECHYMQLDEIIENFEFLDEWEDRYKYLIELGDQLAPYPSQKQDATHKVQGCVSQVWIDFAKEEGIDPIITFIGTSDAHIVRGLIAVVLAIFSGKKASEIVNTDEIAIFNQLDLQEHITPQRANGLRAMVARIKDVAKHNADQ